MAELGDPLNPSIPATDAIVAWRDGAAVSGSALRARSGCWQALLQRLPGRKFALYLDDSAEFAAALFGAWRAGKTVYLPSDTLPATCAALRQAVDVFLGEFPAECSPVSPGPQDVMDPAAPSRALSPDFAGLVVYTSGSTGNPQAIPKKLSQLATEVATLERCFGETLGDADIVATVSHQHIYGLLFKVLWPLAAGRPIHARSLVFPEELAAVTTARDCVLVSSPAHLKRLPESAAWTAAAHRVRAVFSSGGPLAPEVGRATAGLLGQVPIEVYGSSESGGIGWRQREQDADACWTPLPGVEWRIDQDSEALEIRSAHLPDRQWLRMADRARGAEDGRFLLAGRADRIVKLEEKRISLDAIEAQLRASPLVAEARVLVVDGRRQRIAAFVVPSAEGRDVLETAGKQALNQHLRDRIALAVERVALPRVWRYLDALPVNAQGKTTQAELIALLAPAPRPLLPQRRQLEREAQRALFELTAPRDLMYFDGHFPGAPILAGVVQIDWALALGRECFDLPPAFCAIHALKFQRVIQPDTAFSLELLHDPAKSSLAFRYFSAAGPHASGRLLFGAADV